MRLTTFCVFSEYAEINKNTQYEISLSTMPDEFKGAVLRNPNSELYIIETTNWKFRVI